MCSFKWGCYLLTQHAQGLVLLPYDLYLPPCRLLQPSLFPHSKSTPHPSSPLLLPPSLLSPPCLWSRFPHIPNRRVYFTCLKSSVRLEKFSGVRKTVHQEDLTNLRGLGQSVSHVMSPRIQYLKIKINKALEYLELFCQLAVMNTRTADYWWTCWLGNNTLDMGSLVIWKNCDFWNNFLWTLFLIILMVLIWLDVMTLVFSQLIGWCSVLAIPFILLLDQIWSSSCTSTCILV